MDLGKQPEYLQNVQYKDGSNLGARVRLHREFGTAKESWNGWVFNHLADLPTNTRVLELGCGPGLLWLANAGRIPPGWSVTLTDFSSGMLAEAQNNLAKVPHSFEFEQADAQALPFVDGSFEAVVANHMLYHVPNLAKALGEIRRVLVKGGQLFAATNGINSMHELRELAQPFDDAKLATDLMKRPAEAFGLENGADLLQPFFERVRLDRFEDSLVVTQAQPLLDYLESTVPIKDSAKRAEVLASFEQRIAQDGSIFISKDQGLFIASKE